MRPIQIIRSRLGVSQEAMAVGMECSQPNISAYERGQTIPPDAARRLIAFAAGRGLQLSFDHVYGAAAVPHLAERQPHEVAER